ncbi:MAG: porin family protein [Flavobacteriales bacterium]
MKKITLVTLVLLSTLLTQAQDFQKYKIAAVVNPGVAWIKPDSKFITDEGNTLRFGFGINMDIHFTENYAFGTGLTISRQGGNLSYLETGKKDNVEYVWSKTREYKLQYAEVPLSLKLRTNEIGYITYWGQFGIIPGININAKGNDDIDYLLEKTQLNIDGSLTWTTSDRPSITNEDEDIKDDIKIFRVGLLIGAGIEYSLSGNTSVVAGIVYNNGFSNILNNKLVTYDDGDKTVFENGKPKTANLKAMSNSLSLTVGIKF